MHFLRESYFDEKITPMITTSATTEFVDTAAILAELCKQWRQVPCLAVDTEFMRTDTFYPILGLIQISDGEKCWLLDPLALGDLSPLRDVLLDVSVLKIFHACSEDMEVLRHELGVVPTPVFDTQVAAAYVGYGFSRSYAVLVSNVTGVELEKHETRSDWLQRPLSQAQHSYAAEDVYYLLEVYQHLKTRLTETGRQSWVEEDMQRLMAQSAQEENPADYYRKVKNAWQLQPESLAILQAITQWREGEARAKNRPRNRIVSDRVLWEIARNKPRDPRELSRLPDLHPRVQRQYGDQLLGMVADAAGSDRGSWPPPLPRPLPREANSILKKLRAAQTEIADQLDVAREILARKKDLEVIAGSALDGNARLPREWIGSWREAALGQTLLNAAISS